ncbi:MAG: hypothetical protein OEM28_07420 [Nitrosopumilus sp.]|nr:hypothetical protein [Nitrosopumilus sp.]MDH3488091.1 hypothetical protein [Nitrosopumilus sp.]
MEKTINENSSQVHVIKKNSESQKKSVCGVMKDSTLNVIQKLESEIPSLFQEYSDLYTRYLHSIQDIFGTCSLVEKQYFDKMEVDQNTLNVYDGYLNSTANIFESQIDLYANFVKMYIQFKLSQIDSWDKYQHACVNTYAKSWSEFLQRTQVKGAK